MDNSPFLPLNVNCAPLDARLVRKKVNVKLAQISFSLMEQLVLAAKLNVPNVKMKIIAIPVSQVNSFNKTTKLARPLVTLSSSKILSPINVKPVILHVQPVRKLENVRAVQPVNSRMQQASNV